MYIEPLQSVVGNTVAFRVHAPCSASLLLDIFANAVTPQEYFNMPEAEEQIYKWVLLRGAV